MAEAEKQTKMSEGRIRKNKNKYNSNKVDGLAFLGSLPVLNR